MTFRGTVRQGVVVLEPGAALPEGTDVTVTAADQPAATVAAPSTLRDRLLKYAGAIQGLPPDLARNHDHYIHGTPRK